MTNIVSKTKRKREGLTFSWPWILTSFYLSLILILPIFSLLTTAGETLFVNFWHLATEPVGGVCI